MKLTSIFSIFILFILLLTPSSVLAQGAGCCDPFASNSGNCTGFSDPEMCSGGTVGQPIGGTGDPPPPPPPGGGGGGGTTEPPPPDPGGGELCNPCYDPCPLIETQCGYDQANDICDPQWVPGTGPFDQGCYPSCGQSSTCGIFCGSVDAGAPGVPSFTNVVDGNIFVADSAGNVTITWAATSLADYYEINLFPTGNDDCADEGSLCASPATTSYTFLATERDYAIRLRAVNSSCNGIAGRVTEFSAWSPSDTGLAASIRSPISGTVYYDEFDQAVLAGALCSLAGSPPQIQGGASSSVTADEGGSSTFSGGVAGDGTYSLLTPFWNPGAFGLTLNIGDTAQYVCSCPAGCVYSGISSPQVGVPYYITEAREPWFQVYGGNVVALQSSGQAIRNPLPALCVGSCLRKMLLRQNGVAGTSGLVLTGGGAVDLDAGEVGNQVTDLLDEDGANRIASLDSRAAKQNYDYFRRRYDFPQEPLEDFQSDADNAQKPAGVPRNGNGAFLRQGDLTIASAWDVADGESYTIFVEGDLNINAKINVDVGGFLAFFVAGDVIIDPSVGDAAYDDITGDVEGLYVANGWIRTPSAGIQAGGDIKFVGEGSFVGWGGVELGRDFLGLTPASRKANDTNPVELFIARPDIVDAMPERLRAPRYQWSEI